VDVTLGRVYGDKLEKAGFKFAPVDVARDFAFELPANWDRNSIPTDTWSGNHFGFHGWFNWAAVLPQNEVRERVDLIKRNPYLSKRWANVLPIMDSMLRLRSA
jgi:hypothetical protein